MRATLFAAAALCLCVSFVSGDLIGDWSPRAPPPPASCPGSARQSCKRLCPQQTCEDDECQQRTGMEPSARARTARSARMPARTYAHAAWHLPRRHVP